MNSKRKYYRKIAKFNDMKKGVLIILMFVYFFNNCKSCEVTVNSPTICLGQTATLIANGADTYSWSPNIGSGGIITTPPLTTTTTYIVTGTTTSGCTDTAISTVTVLQQSSPDVRINGNVETNYNLCSYGIALAASGADHYFWNTGQTTSTIGTITSCGSFVYTVTGTNNNGCSSKANAHVFLKSEIKKSTNTINTDKRLLCLQQFLA